MMGIGTLMRRVGNPFQAEMLLMNHYADRRKARSGWDRHHGQMVYALKWDPVFHRHLDRSRSVQGGRVTACVSPSDNSGSKEEQIHV